MGTGGVGNSDSGAKGASNGQAQIPSPLGGQGGRFTQRGASGERQAERHHCGWEKGPWSCLPWVPLHEGRPEAVEGGLDTLPTQAAPWLGAPLQPHGSPERGDRRGGSERPRDHGRRPPGRQLWGQRRGQNTVLGSPREPRKEPAGPHHCPDLRPGGPSRTPDRHNPDVIQCISSPSACHSAPAGGASATHLSVLLSVCSPHAASCAPRAGERPPRGSGVHTKLPLGVATARMFLGLPEAPFSQLALRKSVILQAEEQKQPQAHGRLRGTHGVGVGGPLAAGGGPVCRELSGEAVSGIRRLTVGDCWYLTCLMGQMSYRLSGSLRGLSEKSEKGDGEPEPLAGAGGLSTDPRPHRPAFPCGAELQEAGGKPRAVRWPSPVGPVGGRQGLRIRSSGVETG